MSPIHRNVYRFVGLPSQLRFQLIKAFIVVAGVRVALTLFSFRRFQTLLGRFTTRIRAPHAKTSPSRAQLVWAVRTASTRVPHATCLTQALAAQVLFERHGYPAVVHIGVASGETQYGAFQAHAWLESDGEVVIGNSEVPYTRLITLGSDLV